jgi:choline dehydrogenase
MSHPDDWEVMRAGIALAREFFAKPAFDAFRGPELLPGDAARGTEAVDAFIRAHAATGHHSSGTCRMGTDAGAVVDHQCRVRGIDGLRVVDASVMPSIVTGNTNAPTIMIAEKASDMIRGNRVPGLPESELAGRPRTPGQGETAPPIFARWAGAVSSFRRQLA